MYLEDLVSYLGDRKRDREDSKIYISQKNSEINSYILENYSKFQENISNFNNKEYNLESLINSNIFSEYKESYISKKINLTNEYNKKAYELTQKEEFFNKYIIRDSSLESILENYSDHGFGIKKRPERINSEEFYHIPGISPIRKPDSVPEARPEEIAIPASESIPAIYAPVLQSLAEEYPGIRFKGITTLADRSQHEVDILTFEYTVNGQVKQLNIVAKDDMFKERMIPRFLNDVGVSAHMTYDTSTRLLMQYIGEKDLKDVIVTASQGEVIRAVNLALDKIAQIHVLATENIVALEHEYGVRLDKTDYVQEFERRFIGPVSTIISPQLNSLLQAYASFTQGFNPGYFVHGDFHPGNVRMSANEAFVIDYEWAKIGLVFDDVSRFVNSVTRERPDMDSRDFVDHVVNGYLARHNDIARKPIVNDDAMATSLQYAMINDELYKVGEYIAFAQAHPKVAEEKMMKSSVSLLRTLNMIDDAIMDADKRFNVKSSGLLNGLKHSLLGYVRSCPYEELREISAIYQPRIIQSTTIAR
ncbi:aminoglycoside phosphotransferase family protein [Candidatus Woesearchaeota archaeon]|nr:aminoglycoside phosphotransferase family protein [Candidatus Woesearchaeota archaeon]